MRTLEDFWKTRHKKNVGKVDANILTAPLVLCAAPPPHRRGRNTPTNNVSLTVHRRRSRACARRLRARLARGCQPCHIRRFFSLLLFQEPCQKRQRWCDERLVPSSRCRRRRRELQQVGLSMFVQDKQPSPRYSLPAVKTQTLSPPRRCTSPSPLGPSKNNFKCPRQRGLCRGLPCVTQSARHVQCLCVC